MVQPILTNPALAAAGQAFADLDRAVLQPDAARQVTAAQEVLNGNRTGTASQGNAGTQDSGPTSSLETALEQINQDMQAWSTGIRFDMDDEAQRIVVSIVDNATGDVIRTVPSDAVLRVARMIVQMQGNAVDTHA